MRIRDDLDGVVHVHSEGGVVVLRAGDTIPAGVVVGDHLKARGMSAKNSGPNAERVMSPEQTAKFDQMVDDQTRKGNADGARKSRGRRSAPRPDADVD